MSGNAADKVNRIAMVFNSINRKITNGKAHKGTLFASLYANGYSVPVAIINEQVSATVYQVIRNAI